MEGMGGYGYDLGYTYNDKATVKGMGRRLGKDFQDNSSGNQHHGYVIKHIRSSSNWLDALALC
jgi:hypothetical protein